MGLYLSPTAAFQFQVKSIGTMASDRLSFRGRRLAVHTVSQPTRRGFGSAILVEAAQQFGAVTMNYLPEGLIYQLQLDLSEIEIPKNVTSLPNTPRPRAQSVVT